MTRSRLALFDRGTEYVNLIVPLIFVSFSVIEFFFQIEKSFTATKYYEFFKLLIVLDIVHVIISPFFPILFSGFKGWKLNWEARTKLNLLPMMILPFGAGFLTQTIFLISPSKTFLFDLGSTLLFSARVHHTYSQTQGLSLSYNALVKSNNLPISQLTKLIAFEKIERKLFTMLIFTKIVSDVVYIFGSDFFIKPNIQIFYAFRFLIFAQILVILYLSIAHSELRKTNKPIYLLRLFLDPLIGSGYIADIASRAVHGMEYFFLTKKMSTAQTERNNTIRIWVFIAIICPLYVVFLKFMLGNEAFLFHRDKGAENLDFILILTLSVLSGIAFLHFWLDRVYFRMRNPESKQFISPLLHQFSARTIE